MTDIVQKGDSILREKAPEVQAEEFATPKLHKIITDMSEAMASQHDAVAIAAPQIGVSKRIFLISGIVFTEEGEPKADDLVFINPVIKKLSKQKESMDEGCLSVRWKYGNVVRHEKATVTAYDETGKQFTYNGSGLLAQIFQHEIDHLDGILFTDKAENIRDMPDEEIEKIKNAGKQ